MDTAKIILEAEVSELDVKFQHVHIVGSGQSLGKLIGCLLAFAPELAEVFLKSTYGYYCAVGKDARTVLDKCDKLSREANAAREAAENEKGK